MQTKGPVKKTLIILIILIGLMGVLIGIFLQWNGKPSEGTEADLTQTAEAGAKKDSVQPYSPSPEAENQAHVLTETQQEALNLYDEGLALYYDRRFDAALDLFDQAVALDSECYQAINGKGAAYAFQGRYDEGIALIKQAIQMKPDFVYARFNLGLAYELAGHWEEGISAYHEALALDDKDVWSYYGIATIYGRLGNVDKVLEYLKPAIDLQGDVRDVAREERDFDPVKNNERFQALIAE